MLSPSPAVVGVVSVDTIRSDPILSERAAALLASLVSLTSSPLSALAIRYQVPGAVSPGMLIVVEPALLVPAANPGTLRVPSHTSAPSRVALVERKYFVSEASASLPPVLFVDSLIVSYWYRRSPEVAAQIGLISLEAMAVGAMFQAPTAALASRERPYGRECGRSIPANLDDCESRDRYRSYFSGHTTLAFASATVTCSHHARHDLFGDDLADALACATALTSAATVGAMRVVGNKHYLTDVATGAAVGTLSGLAVPWLLHYGPLAQVETPLTSSPIQVTLMPLPGGLAAGGTF